MKPRTGFSAALLGLLLFCSPLRAGVLSGDGIGAYGDSLTWQYTLWVPLSTSFGFPVFSNGLQRNWVDHLVLSGYNFGGQVDITGNGNFYNEYNVAFGGSVSGDLPGQVEQLEPFLASGEVKLTVIEIGGNNFTPEVGNRYATIYAKAANVNYNPLNDPAELAFIDSVVADITAAIDATLAIDPNQHIVLVNVPDLGDTPSIRSTYNVASRRADVTAVVGAINEKLLELAAARGIPLVDLMGIGHLALAPPSVAGVQMLTGGGNSGNRIFLSDGFHPGTVSNGLLANAILKANELAYGDPVTFISDQTIVTRAGLTPAAGPATYYDVSPYVFYFPVPEPTTISLAASAVLCLAAARARQRRKQAIR